jgi:ATP-dependent Lon protease
VSPVPSQPPPPRESLPLFPLPVVLFPGTPLPLHIFEPRYRTMVADCLASDRLFGLVHLRAGATELELETGSIGCVAEIVRSEELPDGRANIVVRGTERFALVELVSSSKPYRVARIQSYFDQPEFGTELDTLSSRVKDMFEIVGRAARTLADDSDPLPDLPDDSSLLSFAIAAVIDLEAAVRQTLLESRSPIERLQMLERVLAPAVPTLVARADVHKRAKSNGKGTHAQS